MFYHCPKIPISPAYVYTRKSNIIIPGISALLSSATRFLELRLYLAQLPSLLKRKVMQALGF
ncbi:unnamed protein product [Periconia digitata]|uniref:Uncharacterized protein n=1 Tax=Periconia digitata TaxID=1303443 RepID=A0A9W4XQC8_9PLEO|nr:unnamed protein product [Periconia digitata]